MHQLFSRAVDKSITRVKQLIEKRRTDREFEITGETTTQMV